MKKAALSLALLFSGCAGLSSVTMPSTYEPGGKQVKKTRSHLNFLGLTPSTNNVEVVEELAKDCASGKLKNVTTELHHRVILILGFEETTVTGNCVE